jgi:hypothetical protein
LARLRADPARLMTAGAMTPDAWQARLLRAGQPRLLLLCGRQCGKSTVAAALALREALLSPPALVLLLSPTQRQSGELFRKAHDLFGGLGRPAAVAGESAHHLELANGSRVVALPGSEGTVRGYSGVALLVVDEAARVPDDLYHSVRPMLAVSRGRLVALSTPFGRRGWFFEEWEGGNAWERVRIRADECPRIPAEFLAEERRSLGERWFAQEYLCSFEQMVGAVFSPSAIQAALSDEIRPLLE